MQQAVSLVVAAKRRLTVSLSGYPSASSPPIRSTLRNAAGSFASRGSEEAPYRIVAWLPFRLVFSNFIGEWHMSHEASMWQILEKTHAECAF